MILSKEQIQKAITGCFTKKPVKRAWLFGSYARGEANEESGLDLLVDMEDNKKVGLRYLAWHEEIGSLVNKKVRLISNAAVSKDIRPYIEADKVLVYER